MDGVTLPPALLPDEAPLPMPEHALRGRVRRRPAPAPPGLALRRLLVFGAAAGMTAFAMTEMWDVLGASRWTVLGAVLTGLFGVLFCWIALAFATAAAGFVLGMAAPRRTHAQAPAPGRTAILMPIYHEPVDRLDATVRAMRASLAAADADAEFDIFVLSDSRAATAREAERAAVIRFSVLPGACVFYRCRTENTHRKAGNIAEWVRRFGAAYPRFVIFDADSLMEAATLRAMALRMAAEPRLGLLQTLPLLHGGQTLFARLQQFASQVYGPTLAKGLAWWGGSEANYWGHNAMIRTRAFAEAAGLPELPGRRPFGGMIMSHDFVEAALLRRAGWAVEFDPDLPGSWEEGPPTLPDLCVRDRRWCQGNLQHAAVIAAPGLHPVSRLHLAQGIFAYLSAPVWLVFLLMALLVAVQARVLPHEYFPPTPVLFPQWPVVDPARALVVFAGTMAVLLAPKLFGAIGFGLSARGPRDAKGVLRLAGGVVLEVLLSALLAPITMLAQIRAVFGILLGRDGGWEPQRRSAGDWSWRDALRFSRLQVVLGLMLLGSSVAIAPLLATWMAPVLLGLLLAPLLVGTTSGLARGTLGSLLTTPSDDRPDPILRLAREPDAIQEAPPWARGCPAPPQARLRPLAPADTSQVLATGR
jgi:membrane glycosyltransferase